MNQSTLLSVNHLKLDFKSDRGNVSGIKDISFELRQGETLGIVGESGSGKSVTALAIMGLLPQTARVSGEILFNHDDRIIDLLKVPLRQMRHYRGDAISMIFQEPMTSLNPLFTCGYQVIEAILQHQTVTLEQAKAQAVQLFQEVRLPNPAQMIDRYPHELSGGQLQRVMIAIAISCNPKILIADEPTTALDVTVQASILALLRQIQQERQMSIIFITHDLGVISQIANQVAVMYKGNIVESGSLEQIFSQSQHPYTKGLIACRPQPELRLKFLPTVSDFMAEDPVTGEIITKQLDEDRSIQIVSVEQSEDRSTSLQANEPLLVVKDLRVQFPIKGFFGIDRRYLVAVNNISFDVYPGETLGLVGESGCGKTTAGRAILRLIKASSGSIQFEGKDVISMSSKQLQRLRREMQIVFQDPYGSLNPRMSVGDSIEEPLEIHRQDSPIYQSKQNRRERVAYLLQRVGLDIGAIDRYPHEFSGGQRQRICIARALALNPKLIIADESDSGLGLELRHLEPKLTRRQ